MSAQSKAKQFKAGLRNADDILYLITGKRLKNIVGTAINVFGEELTRKFEKLVTGEEEPALSPDSPYLVLGIHPDALDVVVKGAYRALAREYHPDTGLHPDPAKFQKATEAYDAIMKSREGMPRAERK